MTERLIARSLHTHHSEKRTCIRAPCDTQTNSYNVRTAQNRELHRS